MTVELTTFKACEKALSEPDLRQALYDAGAVLMEKALVNLHGDEHRARRVLEMQVFRRNFFRQYERETIPAAFNDNIKPIIATGKGDVVDIGQRVMLHLSIAFAGVDPQEHTDEEFEVMLRCLQDFGIAATLGQAKGDRAALEKQVAATLKEFEERFYRPSLERRKKLVAQFEAGEISEEDLPRDILTVLVHKGHTVDLTPEIIMKEAAFYYLAGGHTSVHSLGHAMDHLLTWCEDHPEDREKLENDLHLTQRFVHESFRLHPSSPISKRRALSPVEFVDGQKAGEGDIVVVNLRAANRDESIFGDDAAKFDPYRELPAGINETGITFGVGIHSCLGRNLAAGTFVKPGGKIDPENHQYGAVAWVANGLLRHGARKDPDNAGQLDQTIERETWSSYPIVFDKAE